MLAQTQSKDGVIANKIDALLTGVFSAVLPVFATWVGTVIAFYFTNESFRQAAQVARESASGLIERLRSLPIKLTMLPLKGIKLLKLTAGASLETADLAEVKAAFDQTSKDEPISRPLILDSADRLVAVMHRSMWSELLASDPDTGKALAAVGTQPASAASAGAAAQASQPAPPQTKIDLTLGKLISRPIPGTSSGGTYGDMLRKIVAFVALDKTLADAKAAMEALSGCQDVIVTQSGATTMPVVGWITNTRLARFSQA